MNITMVTTVYGKNSIGGAERTAALLAKQLVQMGHQVSVISLGPVHQAIENFVDQDNVSVWQVPLFQWYDPYQLNQTNKNTDFKVSKIKKLAWHFLDIHNPIMSQKVGQVLDQIQPEIVLTHALQGFSVSVWRAVKNREIKLVHMTHDHALICPATAMTKGAKSCEKICTECSVFHFLRKAVAVQPDAIVGPSAVILKRHQQYNWFKDISFQKVIANAIASDWPVQVSPVLQSPKLVFGFLGRLDESKGLDTLLQACLLLPANSYELKIAGPGKADSFQTDLAKLQQNQHTIELLGNVNAQQFLSQIDILICPSRAFETFSNVVMEASCSGRASIVSDRGALPERVQMGLSGWIFQAGNVQHLAQTMLHCLTHKEEVLDKSNKALLQRDSYSLNHQTSSFLDLFQQVLNTGSSPSMKS